MLQCFEWQARYDEAEVIHRRSEMMEKLELAGDMLCQSGMAEQWFAGADDAVRAVSKDAHGHLFDQLLKPAKHVDPVCVQPLRKGAELVRDAVAVRRCYSLVVRRQYARATRMQWHRHACSLRPGAFASLVERQLPGQQ